MASVELRNLTKKYGPLAVVDDVSLTIEHGTLVCLLGPSGCGKTTTLRLIAGNAPLTIKAVKATVAEVMREDSKRNIKLTQDLVDACFKSNDYQEGRKAFMEKRKPVFTGT